MGCEKERFVGILNEIGREREREFCACDQRKRERDVDKENFVSGKKEHLVFETKRRKIICYFEQTSEIY